MLAKVYSEIDADQMGQMITGLGGGLAMFLFGMRVMTEGLKNSAGPGMKRLLARLTGNRFSALLGGTVVTAVIQSSSVTTVLVVGFISARLMTLKQSIGVIIGANIGTTVTAQIIAFRISRYGLVLIAAGFLLELISKRERWKQAGDAVLGLGLVLFGMELMGSSTAPLQSWQPFLDLMQQMQHPLAGMAAGAVFTTIIQSSSATTGIVIILAGSGLISLEGGIALILGSNVGTCFTALLSSWGKPREAVQASVVHVVFNLFGALLWVAFIPGLADLVRQISPVSDSAAPAARLAAEAPRQLANAHTVFNVLNAFLFIWLTTPLARLAEWLVPRKSGDESDPLRPMYLQDYVLEQPAVALDLARQEILRLGDMVRGMLRKILRMATVGEPRDVELLRTFDERIDTLHGYIVSYLSRLLLQGGIEPQHRQVTDYIAVANYLENCADVMSTNIGEGLQRRLTLGAPVSESTREMLQPMFDEVVSGFNNAMTALRDMDVSAARAAIDSKQTVNKLADQAQNHLARRLATGEPYRIPLFQIESDIIENLKRLNTLSRRIGRVVASEQPSAVEPSTEASHPRPEITE